MFKSILGIFQPFAGKDTEDTTKAIQQEFDLKECYAGKCWCYSTNQADFRPLAKRIGMFLNCGAYTEACLPERFTDKSR